jgi:hypothetical protein
MCQPQKDPVTGEVITKRMEANIRLYPKEKEAFDNKRDTLREIIGKRVSQTLLMEILIDIAYEANLGNQWLKELA